MATNPSAGAQWTETANSGVSAAARQLSLVDGPPAGDMQYVLGVPAQYELVDIDGLGSFIPVPVGSNVGKPRVVVMQVGPNQVGY